MPALEFDGDWISTARGTGATGTFDVDQRRRFSLMLNELPSAVLIVRRIVSSEVRNSYYPYEFKHWSPLLYWLMGAVTAIMLFVSVLLHELGHSVVALRYKIPVRSITLFLFGGVAQIGAEPPSAIAEFFIAIAGPLVSLALAVFFYAAQPLIAGMEPLLGLAKYLAYINMALVLFNLIPGYARAVLLPDAVASCVFALSCPSSPYSTTSLTQKQRAPCWGPHRSRAGIGRLSLFAPQGSMLLTAEASAPHVAA